MNKLQTATLMQADNVKAYNVEAGIVRTAVLSPEQRAERPYHKPKPLVLDISHEEALQIMYGIEAC